jgi:pilus assembly protein FimV
MRKLSWIIAGILCTAPVFVQAAELGDAKIASHLTERLNVKIPITGLNGASLDQVKVRLAPEKYYQQAGLSLDGLSGNITFQVTSEGKQNYVIVRSKRAISNPILSLLIQINSGESAQIKEFDLLLDPPVHAQHRTVTAPKNSFQGNTAKSSQPASSTSSWTPVADVPNVTMGGTYQVKHGDTLYDIAKAAAAANKSVAVRPMMQAIINANPNAFVDGNGNLLKAGASLKVPESVAGSAVPAAATAEKAAAAKPSETAVAETKPKLELLAVDSDKEKAAAETSKPAATSAETGSESQENGVLPAIDSQAAPAASTAQQNNEAIASIDAKSEVMSKQIAMLNDQLKQVQGLVSERNQSIEKLQQKVKASTEQTELLKKQLEAQNNNFWLKWAPYLMGGAGLLIIVLLLLAITRGRKREVESPTIYSTAGAAAGGVEAVAVPNKAVADEPRVSAVEMAAPVAPPSAPGVDPKSVIDEARLLLSYNLHSQAYDLVEEAIAHQPNELSLYQELARMYSESNKTAELENVLARIDDKFGAEYRPNTEELEVYSSAPSVMDSEEASSKSSAPAEPDALDAIPSSAFDFDSGLDMPSDEPTDTAMDFDMPSSKPKGVSADSGSDALSLDGFDEPASASDDINLELGDKTAEVPDEALSELEHIDDSAVQNDTRLGLAEAFLGVGDQESYRMIAEEIEAEGNPALKAALKKIEQKFS